MNGDRSLVELVEASVAEHGDRTAVIDVDGTETTYRELEELANRFAGWLTANGVGPGDRVGVCRSKSVETVAGFLGIMRCGAAYVPVDAFSPPARNHGIFSDCGVSAVLLDQPAAVRMGAVDCSAVLVGSPASGAAEHLQAPNPDDLAYILYTSGSTGRPKGVCLSHRNASSFVEWCMQTFESQPTDRCSSHAPFHFDLSILDLWMPLASGGAIVLVEENLAKDPRRLPEFIAERRITNWYSVPSILGLMAEMGRLAEHDHDALRVVCFAGEVFPIPALHRVREAWPEPRFFNLYGPTETNVCTAHEIPRTIDPARTEPYPIGRACDHCQVRLVDESGVEVASGEVGRLLCQGGPVMQGYWGMKPEQTAGFVELDGVRWYDTGDLGSADADGVITFHGRRDRMVKRHGYRIELGEIEAGLAQMDGVVEVAAWANVAEDGSTRIVAAVSTAAETRPSIIALRTHCGQTLPLYMVPDRFVLLDELPRTSTGKIDYQALAGE
ncbi:MAG: amino acid adenylation domain-containing protein [Phycisphaerales bacterium]|nr:amino acid adenylation domain-containing protein [Phycisphaerales bacterium]